MTVKKTSEQSLNVVIEARTSVPGEDRGEAFERFKYLLTASDNVKVTVDDLTFALKVREVDIV